MVHGVATIDGIPGLAVRIRFLDDGAVRIEGQHLGRGAPGGSEYEYALTVPATDVPRLAEALGCDVDGIRDAWEQQVQSIVLGGGERRWLVERSIPFDFWSRIE